MQFTVTGTNVTKLKPEDLRIIGANSTATTTVAAATSGATDKAIVTITPSAAIGADAANTTSQVSMDIRPSTSAARNVAVAPGLVAKKYEVRNRTAEHLAALYTMSPAHDETEVLISTAKASIAFTESVYTANNTNLASNLWGRINDGQTVVATT